MKSPPKWLTEWTSLLANLGIPAGAWVVVVWLWKSSKGEVPVNIRLLLVAGAGIISALMLMLWSSQKKNKEVKRLTALLPREPQTRSTEEEELLSFLWHNDGGVHPLLIVRFLKSRNIKMVFYQLEQLVKAKLVAHGIMDKFRLTPQGRDYVVFLSLNNKPNPRDTRATKIDKGLPDEKPPGWATYT